MTRLSDHWLTTISYYLFDYYSAGFIFLGLQPIFSFKSSKTAVQTSGLDLRHSLYRVTTRALKNVICNAQFTKKGAPE